MQRGDPALVGQEEAQAMLVRALERVIAGQGPQFVALLDPLRCGRRCIIDAVRDHARMQGSNVGDRPGAGLALIDADADTGWSVRATGEPRVVVWSVPAPDGLQAETHTLEPLELCFVARSRVPVSPYVAALAAERAAGRPGLVVRLLEGWRREPGFEPGPMGLELRRPPGVENAPAREWWSESLAALPPARDRASNPPLPPVGARRLLPTLPLALEHHTENQREKRHKHQH